MWLNISDFNLIFMWKLQSHWKKSPLFPSKPLWTLRSCQVPPLENLVGSSIPHGSKGSCTLWSSYKCGGNPPLILWECNNWMVLIKVHKIFKNNIRVSTTFTCILLYSFCNMIITHVYKNNILRAHGKWQNLGTRYYNSFENNIRVA